MSTTYRTIVLTAAGCEATGGHVLGCIACGARADIPVPTPDSADDATVGEREGYRVSLDLVTGDIDVTPANIPATPPADDANRAPVSGGLDEGEREALAAAVTEQQMVPGGECNCGPSAPFDSHEWSCPMHDANWIPDPAADGKLFVAVERILAARDARHRAAPFRCQTHMCGSCGGCKAAKVTDLLTERTAERDTARREAGERIAVAIEADPDIGRHKAAQRLIFRGDDVGTVLSDLRRSVAEAHARIARADALTSDDRSGA